MRSELTRRAPDNSIACAIAFICASAWLRTLPANAELQGSLPVNGASCRPGGAALHLLQRRAAFAWACCHRKIGGSNQLVVARLNGVVAQIVGGSRCRAALTNEWAIVAAKKPVTVQGTFMIKGGLALN